MDAYDVLIGQIDEKVTSIKDYLAEGQADSYEGYKKLCGEIHGLLVARGYILDLKQNLEHSDD